MCAARRLAGSPRAGNRPPAPASRPQVLAARSWDAYPRFSPPERFAPFALAPGLAYTSALENAASAMEMAAIAGVNAALLTAQHLAAQSQGAGRAAGGEAAAAAAA